MATYRLAWLTLGATLLLLMVGGVVHATGSSLACPDWPMCYGEAFPKLQGGILYEHGHRYLGAAVGVLIAIMAAALLVSRWRGRGLSWKLGWVAYGAIVAEVMITGRLGVIASRAKLGEPNATSPYLVLGMAAFFGVVVLGLCAWLAVREKDRTPVVPLVLGELVTFQATLGGVTVLLHLPTAVSTLHLATSMVIMGGVIYLVFQLRPHRDPAGQPLLKRTALAVALGAVYLQIVLGALVRHTVAGMACGTDLVLCAGTVVPQTGPAWLLFTHRTFAYVVAALVIWSTIAPLRAARQNPRPLVRFFALAAHGLVVLQVGLGLLTVVSGISPTIATAHLMGGALLLAIMLSLYLACGPGGVTRPAEDAPALSLGEGRAVGTL